MCKTFLHLLHYFFVTFLVRSRKNNGIFRCPPKKSKKESIYRCFHNFSILFVFLFFLSSSSFGILLKKNRPLFQFTASVVCLSLYQYFRSNIEILFHSFNVVIPLITLVVTSSNLEFLFQKMKKKS